MGSFGKLLGGMDGSERWPRNRPSLWVWFRRSCIHWRRRGGVID